MGLEPTECMSHRLNAHQQEKGMLKMDGRCVLSGMTSQRPQVRSATRYVVFFFLQIIVLSTWRFRSTNHPLAPLPRCYLGGAHGIAGILCTLLQLPAELSLANHLACNADAAVGQNQWYHFGVSAPLILEPILVVGLRCSLGANRFGF